MFHRILVMTVMTIFLVACGEQAQEKAKQLAGSSATQTKAKTPAAMSTTTVPPRSVDMVQMARGGKLFQQNCADCHGVNAEGAPNWQKQGPDGKWPAPPLNGTAHAWHHPMVALKRTIRDGTQKIGGNMPGWGDKLSEQDMEDIIAWFQAKWPDELYTAWYQADQRSRQQK